MNKIVLEHIPAAELPEKLRRGIKVGATVKVTVEEEVAPPIRDRESFRRMLEQSRKAVAKTGISVEESVARIRELRDEWDR
jgi:ASC-1-like (ASCH) protein